MRNWYEKVLFIGEKVVILRRETNRLSRFTAV